MATNFPISLDAFTNITNPTTTPLQTLVGGRSHSGFHNDMNDTIEALEAKVGIDWSAVASSHTKKIADLQAADTSISAAKADKTITISPGTGLSWGGDLSVNRTLTLANTAVTAGTYTIPTVTIDAQGRITSASNGVIVKATDVQALVATDTDKYVTPAHLGFYDVTIVAGTTYTAGQANTSRNAANATYTKVKEIATRGAGTYTVSFQMRYGGTGTTEGRIYVNGAAVGVEHTTSSTSYATYSDNITVVSGDLIQLYVKSNVWGGDILDFAVKYTVSGFKKYTWTTIVD